ncbi:MAG: 4Fe-4S binding protein [Myxococcota bacterium]|nr:4Fe-4S binding protein [Myxococcota bacterium]
MALRKVVHIDEEKCTGCGECVPACAEGAIEIVDGVARLRADNLCDGLGACLGECPEDAITIEEREAEAFDEDAVKAHLAIQSPPAGSPEMGTGVSAVRPVDLHAHGHGHAPGGGCPGARMIEFRDPGGDQPGPEAGRQPSFLRQWPIQLHLVPPTAPYFKKADVLLAADCVAFAVGDFHSAHLKGASLAVACPKLDQGQEIYLQKLIAMIDEAEINTLKVMVMEVPCCAGLVSLAQQAAARAKRRIPVKRVQVGLRGEIQSEEWL